jgi:hypothetical protein
MRAISMPRPRAFDFFLIAVQHREGAAADGAEAQQANFDRFHAACDSLVRNE